MHGHPVIFPNAATLLCGNISANIACMQLFNTSTVRHYFLIQKSIGRGIIYIEAICMIYNLTLLE